MKEVEAIILAGGEGKRMGDVTRGVQKCLLPIDGEPILYHIFRELIKAFGSIDVKIGVSCQADQVKKYVDRIKSKMISVTYVPHGKAVGTYGAYRTMEDHVKGPFVGLPGDVIAKANAYESVSTVFEQSSSELAISLSPVTREADSHGLAKITNGAISSYVAVPQKHFLEDGYLRELDIISAKKLFFSMLHDYSAENRDLSTSISKAVASGREIAGYRYDEEWVHIAYVDDLKKPYLGINAFLL